MKGMVAVDKEKCIGCGLCPEVCGKVFFMNKEGKAEVKEGFENENSQEVKDAIECCPVDAISE